MKELAEDHTRVCITVDTYNSVAMVRTAWSGKGGEKGDISNSVNGKNKVKKMKRLYKNLKLKRCVKLFINEKILYNLPVKKTGIFLCGEIFIYKFNLLNVELLSFYLSSIMVDP